MDTFDASDFLREFDNLQPVDIMAQAIFDTSRLQKQQQRFIKSSNGNC